MLLPSRLQSAAAGANGLRPLRASSSTPPAFTHHNHKLGTTASVCSRPTAICNAQDSHPVGETPTPTSPDLSRCAAAVCATAICYTLLTSAQPARAEERAWKPRRHYRRLGERWSNTWAAEFIEEQEIVREQQAQTARREQQLQREREEAEAAQRRVEEAARRKKAEAILAKQAQERARAAELPFSVKVGDRELAPYIIWGGIALAAWLTFKGTVAGVQRIRRGRGQGKWVYDRSLGGKKVWVPAEGSTQDKPSISDREFDKLTSIAAAAGSAVRSSPEAATAPAAPSWWQPLPRIPVEASLQAARQQDVDRLVSRMEASRNRGEDFTLADVVRLRDLCQEGQAQANTRTVGARDALFRTAVDAAVMIAMDPAEASSSDAMTAVADGPPIRFLASLAEDIQLPTEKAAGVICAQVAAAARARLVDALAGIKEDASSNGQSANGVNQGEMTAVMSLVRLTSLLAKLPVLTGSSTEVALIAESLQRSFTVDERRRAFYLLGQLYPEAAALAANLLGFDPAAVVPQLLADMEEYHRQFEEAAARTQAS